ncbi:hypothetical protein ACHHYP_12261, partial [Achlya hypogyna]
KYPSEPAPNGYRKGYDKYQDNYDGYRPARDGYQKDGYQKNGYQKGPSGYRNGNADYQDGYSGYNQRQPDGYSADKYGKNPSKDRYGNYGGYDDHRDNYGGYDPEPKPARSDEDNFHLFYDNLNVCTAENALESCIISSASRADCMSVRRIEQCTTTFVTSLCDELATTTTGSYDNGYVQCTAETCTNAALADSLLVYNRLLSDVNTALAVTPQFDQWSFTTIKLALASTRHHADCVIKAFFNYLGGCAQSSVLPERDLTCLDKALTTSQCEWAYETADGWNLPQFLQKYGSLAFNGVVSSMHDRFGITPTAHAIDDLLADVTDEATQFVQFVNTEFDYEEQTTSVDVCSFAVEEVDAEDGTNIDAIKFHFPTKRSELVEAAYAETCFDDSEPGKQNLYKTCAKFFDETKKAFKENAGVDWTCRMAENQYLPMRINADGDVECWADDGEHCAWKRSQDECENLIKPPSGATLLAEESADPSLSPKQPVTCGAQLKEKSGSTGYDQPGHWCTVGKHELGNQGDKCFTYSGYSIFFLETGEEQPLTLTDVKASADTVPNAGCRRASWSEPHSCNSHLTQWRMKVGCCQSYASVLLSLQDEWSQQYGDHSSNSGRYGKHGSSKQYGNGHDRVLLDDAQEAGYTKSNSRVPSEPPAKPTCVPDKFDPKTTAYEATIVSRSDTDDSGNHGAILSFVKAERDKFGTNSIDTLTKGLDTALEYWFAKCQQLYDDYGGSTSKLCGKVFSHWHTLVNANEEVPGDVKQWCDDHPTAVSLTKPYDSQYTRPATLTYDTATYGYNNGQLHASYMGASAAYADVCDRVHVDWDMDTVVPIVSTQCFPQACVLAQLAQCMDIPEPPKSYVGYDYVAQPQRGYNGYRPSNYQRPSSYNNYNSYSKMYLGLAGPTTSLLALVGFVAGIVVVAVAQVVLQARRGASTAHAYRLV